MKSIAFLLFVFLSPLAAAQPPPAPADSNEAMVERIVDSLGSQIDLLFGLSVAVCGGLVALIFQVIIHNRNDDTTRIKLRGLWWLSLAALCEAASILCGYLSRGAITANLPAIARLDFTAMRVFAPPGAFPGYSTLETCMFIQFAAFAAGFVFIFFALFRNRKLI